jgi:site-specific DNA recombinase
VAVPDHAGSKLISPHVVPRTSPVRAAVTINAKACPAMPSRWHSSAMNAGASRHGNAAWCAGAAIRPFAGRSGCRLPFHAGGLARKGRSIPMEKLDSLVAEHIADRLLPPERLEEVLASVLDRRQERGERGREHISELNKRAVETDLRLKRLYDAIEAGVADLGDPALKERIASLKAIRNQAQVESARAAAMLETSGQQAITPQMVQRFARTARERIRIDGGGYRREHLRALAQRVEVADGEVRIIGSKTTLLQTLAAASGVKSATPGVRSSVLKWRMGWDSNPRTLAGWRFSRPLP